MANRFSILVFFLAVLATAAFGQKKPANSSVLSSIQNATITKQNLTKLRKAEDSLQILSHIVMWDSLSLDNRKVACYKFIPKLLNALKADNSFYYPFDSLTNVSKVYPPDSSFRILTWQLHYPKGHFRYYGLIQMKSEKMKIFPLRDLRDTLSFHTQQVLTADNWYGCVYYNIMQQTINKQKVYTLFGFEAADFTSRRKIIEILRFDESRKPVFGAPLFHFKSNDSFALKPLDTLSRFFIEYKWNASPTLNYDKNLEIIVFDHLAPQDPRAKGAFFAYVPDGTYEGFKWIKGRWQWIEKVFTFAINEDDNPPIPVPLFGTPKKQPVLPNEMEKY